MYIYTTSSAFIFQLSILTPTYIYNRKISTFSHGPFTVHLVYNISIIYTPIIFYISVYLWRYSRYVYKCTFVRYKITPYVHE